jgi:hypothetical protein
MVNIPPPPPPQWSTPDIRSDQPIIFWAMIAIAITVSVLIIACVLYICIDKYLYEQRIHRLYLAHIRTENVYLAHNVNYAMASVPQSVSSSPTAVPQSVSSNTSPTACETLQPWREEVVVVVVVKP